MRALQIIPHKDKGNEPLHLAIQKIYAIYMPNAVLGQEYNEQMAARRSAISKEYGFIENTYKLYQRTRTLKAEDYAALIGTYSDHRALGKERLAMMQNEINDTINSFGGNINIYDTLDLQLARKP